MNNNENRRHLSKSELRRLERFNIKKDELLSRGYTCSDLTTSVAKANIFALLLAVPLLAVFLLLFVLYNSEIDYSSDGFFFDVIIYLFALIILIPVHELIHGITWGILSENGFKDIEFGFIKEYLTPYCTCTSPLKKSVYLMGGLMPLLILGIIPSIICILLNSIFLLGVGLIMICAAGGDILLALMILLFRTEADDVLFYDHPTAIGCVVFERESIKSSNGND